MILVIDIGNTLVKIGLFKNDKIIEVFKVKSKLDRTSDEYAKVFKDLCLKEKCEGAIIASVVPLLTLEIQEAILKATGIKALILSDKLETNLPIKIDNPQELGADFICDAIGAMKKYKYPLVVADLGTASKMFVIDKSGSFIGGMISSGMRINLEALVSKTAQLMDVPIETPSKIVASNTKECIQSGIIYGQAYMISEFARRMEKELGYELERVLTGGFSGVIKDEVVCFHYEPTLSLEGLYEIYKMNK